MEVYRAGEDYLKAIYILQKKNGIVHSMDVARRLKVSKATVSRAMRLLREGGFLTMDSDKRLHLTPAGTESAEQVYEKYRVLTAWLVHMGVDAEAAETDACRIEHVISDTCLAVLKTRLAETLSGT